MGEGVPEGFYFLCGDHGFAAAADGGADDDGGLGAGFLDGDEGGFGIEGIEDGFDHEDVAVGREEGVDLVTVGVFYLIEGDGAEGGVIWVDDVGEGDGEGSDGSGDVALTSGGLADFICFLLGELDGFDVELPDEVLKHLIGDDFFIKELGVFDAAGFAGVLDEELGLGEDGAGEGIGLADVGAGLVEALVDVGDDIGAGEREDVAIVQEVLVVVLEAVAAGVGLLQFVAADGGSHGSIEDHDALAETVLKLGEKVVLHELAGGGIFS